MHGVIYLLFNEGYLSAHAEQAIRRELCDEAIRLATLLAEHPVGAVPETFALVALMHFHAARLGARLDATGGLLLLEEQDRSLWDRERIQLGATWLQRAASGESFSRFHAEAGIAAEHCFAPSFAETRWKEIADLYEMLERIAPSPLHTLNRAVAVAEWQGRGGGARVAGGDRAAGVAGRVVPVGRGAGGPAPARGQRGERAPASRAGAGGGADGRRADAAPAPPRVLASARDSSRPFALAPRSGERVRERGRCRAGPATQPKRSTRRQRRALRRRITDA